MDNLTLDNVSFGQELESTFDGDDFEARRRPIRNSTRKGSKKIAAAIRRVKLHERSLKKARTNLKRVRSKVRWTLNN